MSPCGELFPGNIGVIAFLEDVPVGEDADASEPNVDSYNHVAEEDPGSDKRVVGAAG